MDDTVRLTVDLPAELYRELERAVERGQASDIGEIVRPALWQWYVEPIDFVTDDIEVLRQMLDEAEASGFVQGFDVDKMIAEERAKLRG